MPYVQYHSKFLRPVTRSNRLARTTQIIEDWLSLARLVSCVEGYTAYDEYFRVTLAMTVTGWLA